MPPHANGGSWSTTGGRGPGRPSRYNAARATPFSNRDSVGCDASDVPDTGSRPTRSLCIRAVAEPVGVVAVGVTAGDAEDMLADQLGEGVPDLRRRALVDQAEGERLHQAVHALGRLEQNGATIGTRLRTVEAATNGLSNRFEQRTVCDIVSDVRQGPPW